MKIERATPSTARGLVGSGLVAEIETLGPEAQVGMMVHAHHPNGGVGVLRVVGLDDKTVRLDPNHLLAGKDLVFEVEVVKVEMAITEEIAHGHVH